MWNLLFLAGLASLLWGIWQVSPPVAWMVGGLLLTVISILGSIGSNDASSKHPAPPDRAG